MKRCGSSSGSDRPRDLQPPPVLSFITLITYLFSRTLVSSCPWLGLANHSLHLTLPWWLTYQHSLPLSGLPPSIHALTSHTVSLKKMHSCRHFFSFLAKIDLFLNKYALLCLASNSQNHSNPPQTKTEKRIGKRQEMTNHAFYLDHFCMGHSMAIKK